MAQLFWAIVQMAVGVGICALYFLLSNRLLDHMYHWRDAEGKPLASRRLRVTALRPWVFLGPAVLALTFYLVWPVFQSLWLSVHDNAGREFVGLSNYQWLMGDPLFRESIFNNMLWLLFVPAMTTAFGLIIAVMADRLSWGGIAKSLIFMPMAISFIGASVIWKFVYDYRGEGSEQIGLLNAIIVGLGFEPQAWITLPFWNNFFLMFILVWIQTGFAMVILSAALRGVPEETIEAAIIDGASGIQVFFYIIIPQIWQTIAVVWTTITILVLKVFDIVLAMTNGQWNTQVLANLMFDWMFRGGGDFGRGAAISVVIMILVIPIMIWNIKRAQSDLREH